MYQTTKRKEKILVFKIYTKMAKCWRQKQAWFRLVFEKQNACLWRAAFERQNATINRAVSKDQSKTLIEPCFESRTKDSRNMGLTIKSNDLQGRILITIYRFDRPASINQNAALIRLQDSRSPHLMVRNVSLQHCIKTTKRRSNRPPFRNQNEGFEGRISLLIFSKLDG